MTEETQETNEQGAPAPAQKEEPDRGTNDPSLIEQAKKLHADIKGENDRRELILKQEEALQAERMISGTADAGQAPVKPAEETDKEYADRIMRGETRGDEGRYD